MAIDMDAMLAKIKDRQWALADIDWDAPGAETISDEFRPKLKAFMADLCWIENVGARGFAAMAKKAPTPTLAEIYRYFHAEEQRHANAELALMKRWGMLEDGEMPEPNVNIRLAIEWLDKLLRRHVAVGARHGHPDARGRPRRRAAEVPARRGPRPGLPPGLREDQQRRVPAHRRRLRGAQHDRPRQGAQAGHRVRRQRRHPRPDHRRADVRAAAEPDAQQHRRHGPGARAALQRDEAVQEARRPRRIHLAGADLPGAQAARPHGGQPATTPTTCWPTRWSGRRDRYPKALLSPIPTWFKELTYEPAA